MPKYLINEENELLVLIYPKKKKYQSGQKSGNVCTYYADNYLRKRVGKSEINNNRKIRENEKFHSTVRKAISLANDIRVITTEIFQNSKQDGTINWDKCNEYLEKLRIIFKTNPKSYVPELPDLIKEKLDMIHNLGLDLEEACKYLLDNQHETDIQTYENALENLGVDVKELKADNPDDQLSMLDGIYMNMRRESYGIDGSTWQLKDGFDKLMDDLRKHGPHIANGFYGTDYFTTPPAKKELAECDLYEFDISSYDPQEENQFIAHSIVIVGGKREASGKEIIYFIDPMDEFTEDNPAPFYAIEYEFFVSKCLDIYGQVKDQSPHLLFANKEKQKAMTDNHILSDNNHVKKHNQK